MASLFKPTTVSYWSPPVPNCTKARCKKRGKCKGHKASPAEAKDESGKLRPGFHRKKEKSKKWYARIRYPDGRVNRLPLFADKAASEVRLGELVTDAEQRETGIRDEFQEHRKRLLLEHLEDFKRFLIAKENTPEYATLTYTRAKAVLEGCKFLRMKDLSPSAVVSYL